MRTCRDVSELVSRALDRELRLRERLAVRAHLLVCRGCRHFERQLAFLRRAAQACAARGVETAQRVALRPQARARIRERLAREG